MRKSGINKLKSLQWYKRAAALAPYNLEFRNKYASGLAANNDLKTATKEFEYILQQNPKMVSAYSNLGYIKLIQGSPTEAKNFLICGPLLLFLGISCVPI